MIHYVPAYFKAPTHPITVALVGVGGNGSRMLVRLAEIHQALLQLGHKGLYVEALDPDTVSEHNIGRQGFYPGDIGQYKSEVLIARVNRSYGINWKAHTQPMTKMPAGNIVITCVDEVKPRLIIWKKMLQYFDKQRKDLDRQHWLDGDMRRPYYWLDLGNSQHTGQIVMGTVADHPQPEKVDDCLGYLPNIVDLFPDIEAKEDKDAPSCSMAEALLKQDLCINDMMAALGKKLVWQLFREHYLTHHGVFINLKTFTTNPVTVQPHEPVRTLSTLKSPYGRSRKGTAKVPAKTPARRKRNKVRGQRHRPALRVDGVQRKAAKGRGVGANKRKATKRRSPA